MRVCVCVFWVGFVPGQLAFCSGISYPYFRRNKTDLQAVRLYRLFIQCTVWCKIILRLYNQYSSYKHKSLMHCSAGVIVLCLSLYCKHHTLACPALHGHVHTRTHAPTIWVCMGAFRFFDRCVQDCHEPGSRWRWGFIDFNRITLLSNNSTAWGKEGP